MFNKHIPLPHCLCKGKEYQAETSTCYFLVKEYHLLLLFLYGTYYNYKGQSGLKYTDRFMIDQLTED